MKKFFLIFIIIFSLIGFVGCTQKDDTKSQFIKDFDIDIEEKDIELKEECNCSEPPQVRRQLLCKTENRKIFFCSDLLLFCG